MTDDIVIRLRTKRMGVHTDELLEAADEIERLRAEVEKAYISLNYWQERCVRAEECLDFIFNKKRRWRLW